MKPSREVAAIYFGLQGVAILCWWCLLLFKPETRQWFHPEEFDPSSLMAFALPDMIVAFAGVLVTVRHLQGHSVSAVAWAAAGGMCYASLYCLAITAMTGKAMIALVLMAPAAVLSVGAACVLQNHSEN